MEQTERELTRILRAKDALRTALNDKGASLGEGDLLDDYAPAVQSLPTAQPIKLVDGNNFQGWSKLTTLPLIDASTLTTAYCLAYRCANLQSVSLDLPKATNASHLLDSCTSLQSATLNLPEATSAKNLLNACGRLSDIKLSGLKCSLSLLGTAVTFQSVTYIIEHAQEAISGAIITLPRAMERTMPEELIEQAVEKGFEVTFK